jgi:hypothetical protein
MEPARTPPGIRSRAEPGVESRVEAEVGYSAELGVGSWDELDVANRADFVVADRTNVGDRDGLGVANRAEPDVEHGAGSGFGKLVGDGKPSAASASRELPARSACVLPLPGTRRFGDSTDRSAVAPVSSRVMPRHLSFSSSFFHRWTYLCSQTQRRMPKTTQKLSRAFSSHSIPHQKKDHYLSWLGWIVGGLRHRQSTFDVSIYGCK